MEIKNTLAMGIASQVDWLSNKLANHNSVKSFNISWDGESEHLQGTVTMDLGPWIRATLAEQTAVRELQEQAFENGVQQGVTYVKTAEEQGVSRGN